MHGKVQIIRGMNKPHELSIKEWKEILALPAVREYWGLDDNTTPEEFANLVYGVRFDFVSGSPGYVGDLYVLCGDALGEPITLIRGGNKLRAVLGRPQRFRLR